MGTAARDRERTCVSAVDRVERHLFPNRVPSLRGANNMPSLVGIPVPTAHPQFTGTFRKALFSSMFMITGGMAEAGRKEMRSQYSQPPASSGTPSHAARDQLNLPTQVEEGTLTHGRRCHANAGHHHLENGLLGCCCGFTHAVPILIRDRDPQLELSAGTEGVSTEGHSSEGIRTQDSDMSPREAGILLYPIHWLTINQRGSQLDPHSHLAAALNRVVQGPLTPWAAIRCLYLQANPSH